jgi:hypothetical protein
MIDRSIFRIGKAPYYRVLSATRIRALLKAGIRLNPHAAAPRVEG